MPAADPHVERLDRFAFEFRGVPGRTYRMFEYGDVQVRCTLAAIPGVGSDTPRTIMADVTIQIGEIIIAMPLDGQVRVWSKDFDFAIHMLICTIPAHKPHENVPGAALNAIPYINWDFLRHLGPLEGMRGLIIDGDESPECEERERLHG